MDNPYLFQGRRWDTESKLYYYRNRYYDPGKGRFVSRDPLGIWYDISNFGNGYVAFVLNSMKYFDVLGLQHDKDFSGFWVEKSCPDVVKSRLIDALNSISKAIQATMQAYNELRKGKANSEIGKEVRDQMKRYIKGSPKKKIGNLAKNMYKIARVMEILLAFENIVIDCQSRCVDNLYCNLIEGNAITFPPSFPGGNPCEILLCESAYKPPGGLEFLLIHELLHCVFGAGESIPGIGSLNDLRNYIGAMGWSKVPKRWKNK